MRINIIGKQSDGTRLGEDDSGVLYRGTDRQVEWSAITRTVRNNGGYWIIEYWYGEQLYGKATIKEGETTMLPNGDEVLCYDPNNDPGLIPPKDRQVVMPDGTVQTIPRTISVIDWEMI